MKKMRTSLHLSGKTVLLFRHQRHASMMRGIGTSQCHALDSETGHSGGDRTEPRGQRSGEATPSIKRCNDHGDDTSRDDHVLERHHAVLVRAQTDRKSVVKGKHNGIAFLRDEKDANIATSERKNCLVIPPSKARLNDAWHWNIPMPRS